MARPKTPKTQPSKQTKLPGSDSDRIASIDKEGERFAMAEKAIADATADRTAAKAQLERLMREHDKHEYVLVDLEPPMKLTLEDRGETLTVKKLKPAKHDDNERVLDA